MWNIEDLSNPIWKCDLKHTLAVKGIDFCPWAPRLLATGGGNNDRHLRFWHTETGTLLRELDTHRQVTSIKWSIYQRELVVTFGFDDVSPSTLVAVYAYPSLQVKAHALAKNRRSHCAEVSPDQSKIAVFTSDGTVCLYELWKPKNTALRASLSSAGQFSSSIIDMIEGVNIMTRSLR